MPAGEIIGYYSENHKTDLNADEMDATAVYNTKEHDTFIVFPKIESLFADKKPLGWLAKEIDFKDACV